MLSLSMREPPPQRELLLHTTAGAKLVVAIVGCLFFFACGVFSFALVPSMGVVPGVVGAGCVLIGVLLGLGALERRSPVRLCIDGKELIVRQRLNATSMEVVRVEDIVDTFVEVEPHTDSDGDPYETYGVALRVASGEVQRLASYAHMTNRDEAERLRTQIEAFLASAK